MLVCLITLDCVRSDHLGGELTPALNALAPEWTTFEQAFAQSQNTLSSHLTMLTSNYLFQHGVYSNYTQKTLPPHALPARLRALGWDCQAITGVDFLAQFLGNQVGGRDPRFPDPSDQSLVARVTRRLYGRRAPAEKTLARGLRWLAAKGRRRDAFLWLHLFDAHMVYEAPPAFKRAHVTAEGGGGKSVTDQLREKGWFSPHFPEYDQPLPLEHFPQRYRAAVAYQDSRIGEFVAALKARGWWDEALFVVTADHGECLMGDHAVYCAHKKLFDTTVHVPLRVKFPRGSHAGETVGALVQHVDLAPTVASLAGFEEPLYMGRDLQAVAQGRDPGHAVVFSEHVDNFLRCARDRDWIYVEEVPGQPNRWGLAMEPGNLFRRDAAPAPPGSEPHARRLKERLDALLSGRPEVAGAWGESREAEAEMAERLKELGYM